jgi:hypothetical protein
MLWPLRSSTAPLLTVVVPVPSALALPSFSVPLATLVAPV